MRLDFVTTDNYFVDNVEAIAENKGMTLHVIYFEHGTKESMTVDTLEGLSPGLFGAARVNGQWLDKIERFVAFM